MELLYMILISSVLTCVSLYYVFNNIHVAGGMKNVKLDRHPLPPGSTGWPIIGETLEYLSTAKKGVPENFVLDRINKYLSSAGNSCKVFKTSLLLQDMAVLCTAGGNKFLFSNEEKLVKSWWPAYLDKLIVGNSEKTLNITEESNRFRMILAPYLKPAGLQKYIGTMDSVTKKYLVTYWDHKDQVKVHQHAKKYAFTLACKLMLDTEDPQLLGILQRLLKDLSSGFTALPIDLPGTTFNRAIRASRQLREEIEKIVVERRIQLSTASANSMVDEDGDHGDMLSSLLMETYSDGKQITESEIADKLYGVIVAGHDGLSSALTTIMMYLAELPQVYDAVFKEQMEIANSKAAEELLNWGDVQKMKYSWSVACEAMRLLPPSLGTFREATTDFVYEGHLIPKGMKLYWHPHSTHKNPECFPNPEKFDPSRFEGQGPPPFAFVPFGGGPRMCPGKEYARLKILVFMHNVVTKYKLDKVFPDEKFIWTPVHLPTKGLPIKLFPHNKSK
ncbi:beta-amyrin 28-monooxygenase-like [Pyrus x bretschneideri]|uniref:beta-amyrin 28-monooxygenase-like n=1 Tax=Pyrus x bretschneideri TaxID=225117 RepID=UPI00202E00FE|nr:beta-amyrin 28-monooxygenase-like [Pyrus x bretschneideri]